MINMAGALDPALATDERTLRVMAAVEEVVVAHGPMQPDRSDIARAGSPGLWKTRCPQPWYDKIPELSTGVAETGRRAGPSGHDEAHRIDATLH